MLLYRCWFITNYTKFLEFRLIGSLWCLSTTSYLSEVVGRTNQLTNPIEIHGDFYPSNGCFIKIAKFDFSAKNIYIKKQKTYAFQRLSLY